MNDYLETITMIAATMDDATLELWAADFGLVYCERWDSSSVNEAQTELCRIIAVMEDSVFENFAQSCGIYRLIAIEKVDINDWKIQESVESMSEFRARFIDIVRYRWCSKAASHYLENGYEIDIVSGDRVYD